MFDFWLLIWITLHWARKIYLLKSTHWAQNLISAAKIKKLGDIVTEVQWRWKLIMLPRLRCQTQSGYVQTVPDWKCLCPDRPRRKVDMSRLFVRSSCVRRQIYPDHPRPKRYMSRPSCVHVQTIVLSSVFPDRVILNARHPLRAFISVWTYLVSAWDLSLGGVSMEGTRKKKLLRKNSIFDNLCFKN